MALNDKQARTRKRPARQNEGRPSKYDPALCEVAEAQLAEGHSVEACAGYIGVAKSTIYEWIDQHPEFSDAVKRGQAKSALWWENQLRKVAMHGGGPGTATAVIFGLKNRAPDVWREKSTQEVVGKNDGPVQTEAKVDFTGLSQEERDALRGIFERRAQEPDGSPSGA